MCEENWVCLECAIDVAGSNDKCPCCLSPAPACSIAPNDGVWRLRYKESKEHHAGCTITVIFRVVDGVIRGPQDAEQKYPPATFVEYIGQKLHAMENAIRDYKFGATTLERCEGQ